MKPAEANGFVIGADQPFTMTFDDTDATATHGVYCDPGKVGTSNIIPVQVINRLSVFNKAASTMNVFVAWLENVTQ